MVNKDIVIADYLKTRNVWKTGANLGMAGQNVHKILCDNNIPRNINHWTKKDDEELKELYGTGILCGDGKLKAFAKNHNRTTQFICRKAKLLGLTDRGRKPSDLQVKRIIGNTKKWHSTHTHPRGMLGKHHTPENVEMLRQNLKKSWADPNSKMNSKEHRQMLSDRSSKMMAERLKNNPHSVYSKSKKGTLEIGGKTFFARSGWEANIAAYFQFLKEQGQIKDWVHEPKTFWFEKIKRGVRSYKPDFLITRLNGTQYYEEVKGWMDDKSKTKIKRMKKYYPEIELCVLDEKRYKAISKNKSLIPNWGLLD